MKILNFSKSTTHLLDDPTTDPINIFCQYYIDSNMDRAKEINQCLRLNNENPYISNIYLLNERIYTPEELNIAEPNKIIQVDMSKRISYQDVFKYITDNNIIGYHVILNSDILLDGTINKIRYSDMHLNKKMHALLRYELDTTNIKKSKIFGPRFDSQDTWILHSNFNILPSQQKIFNFQFGKPGCDNKLIYLMNILGYEIINDPLLIKTYHYHTSQVRNYNNKDVIKQPWGFVVPYNIHYSKLIPSLGVDLSVVYMDTKLSEIKFDDNTVLYNYILKKNENNQHFIVPRIAGIENDFAMLGDLIKTKGMKPDFYNIIKKNSYKMKNNAGIKLLSIESIVSYSQMYIDAFANSDMYFGWEMYDGMSNIKQSYDYIKNKLNKQIIWASVLDIYHYIYACPWTLALKGKKVLIISSFAKSIEKKIPIREKIFGIDLFPDCEITTIAPPQTQGGNDSEEFIIELQKFTSKLDLLEYDVALVSCGGYGNLVCNYIYNKGKSAIYVGGVLQMYFGILGSRWLTDRPDVIRLFLNEHWSKPSDEEKPEGYKNIENGCYW
jgi:hypothetical protein